MCYLKRMFGNSLCPQTILSVLTGQKFLLLRPCATAMARISKDGRYAVSMGITIQECDFDISYRKGSSNTNADALSHRNQPHPTESTALTVAVESFRKLAHCLMMLQENYVMLYTHLLLHPWVNHGNSPPFIATNSYGHS